MNNYTEAAKKILPDKHGCCWQLRKENPRSQGGDIYRIQWQITYSKGGSHP